MNLLIFSSQVIVIVACRLYIVIGIVNVKINFTITSRYFLFILSSAVVSFDSEGVDARKMLEENQRQMDEMEKSWQQRLDEAKRDWERKQEETHKKEEDAAAELCK